MTFLGLDKNPLCHALTIDDCLLALAAPLSNPAEESAAGRHRMVPSQWDCVHSIGLKRSAAKLR
jgi:hypothetical protein